MAAFQGRNPVAMAALAVSIICAGVAPLLVSGYVLQLATDILTFAALAYSWNIISGCTGYLSFGQVSFFGIGAYATSVLVIHTGMPWYVAAPIASALAGARRGAARHGDAAAARHHVRARHARARPHPHGVVGELGLHRRRRRD